ncbi:MAG TPA: hypothetical protein VHT94_17930 [Streptosporangiaceae bacterium]|nr:hypothetical protein [Streptosporangiaceae bacterium]
MTTHFEDIIRQNSQRLADLKKTTEDLQRELSEARVSLERQLSRSTHGHEAMQEQFPDLYLGLPEEALPEPHADPISAHYPPHSEVYYSADEPPFVGEGPRSEPGYRADPASAHDPVDVPDPTVGIVNHGRQSAYRRGISRRAAIAMTGAAVALATVLAVILSSGGASWPASVATVQAEIATACQNPDVVSEPGQVNFACAKATRQVLWVFALLTSDNNPQFEDTKTGRQGLEPITPAQGGQVAGSLNLHHPYDPANPIDSIAVAARAINDIIGGATLTETNGNPMVQSGLEGNSGNCLRYTGSGLVTSRRGFPDVCTHRVTTAAGQAALVADVYRKWIVGASTGAADDAAVLFTNAQNPGNPQVQAILRQLGHETLAA